VIVLPACAAKRNLTVVDSVQLSHSRDSLANQPISVSGCLTKHQHGIFLAPCSNADSRNLTVAQDPDNVVFLALPALRAKVFYRVKGEFHGVLSRQAGADGRMIFRLDSVGNIVEHEP